MLKGADCCLNVLSFASSSLSYILHNLQLSTTDLLAFTAIRTSHKEVLSRFSRTFVFTPLFLTLVLGTKICVSWLSAPYHRDMNNKPRIVHNPCNNTNEKRASLLYARPTLFILLLGSVISISDHLF